MSKIYNYGEVSNSEIVARDNIASNVEGVVSEIIADVRANGDKALLAYAKKFDKADLTSLEVSAEEIDQAFREVDPKFLEILREAAKNIRAFHEKQVRQSFIMNENKGVVTGQKLDASKMGIRAYRLFAKDNTDQYGNSELTLKGGCLYIEQMKARDGKTDGWGLFPFNGERGHIGVNDKDLMAK